VTSTAIGFVGLGNMGGRIALLSATHLLSTAEVI